MWQVPVVFAAVMGALGCSASTDGQGSGPNTAPEYAITQSGGSVVQATVDGSRIYGPMIMLERDEQGLRGTGPLGVVDLRKDGDMLRGIIGQWPTELHLERNEDEGFRMRGMFRGLLGSIEITPERIQGQLGSCQYNLRRYPSSNGVAYNGRRFCGPNNVEPTTVNLAPTIASLPPPERAAIIAILLGR
jgi:hypothetical protein